MGGTYGVGVHLWMSCDPDPQARGLLTQRRVRGDSGPPWYRRRRLGDHREPVAPAMETLSGNPGKEGQVLRLWHGS